MNDLETCDFNTVNLERLAQTVDKVIVDSLFKI